MRSWQLLLLAVLPLQLAKMGSAAEQGDAWYCETQSDRRTSVEWIETELGPQKVVAVATKEKIESPTLVVFLHADSPFGDPIYQYDIAKSIARSKPDIVAAAVLRPGYADDCGHQSGGEVGHKMGDNYTDAVVSSVATSIRELMRRTEPKKIIVMGHSGGAALAALLASRYPEIADRTILVACPCDLTAWRESMARLTDNSRWLTSMPGLSPIDHVDRLDSEKKIDLWVGDADVVTPPFLSKAYAEKARSAGKKGSLQVVPDGDHDMILDPDTLNSILTTVFD